MTSITLTRSGQSSLQFFGELIASATSRGQGPCDMRWHDLAIYRADARLVLGISYCTKWQGEHNRFYAEVCENTEELRAFLAITDPLADLIGFPPGAQFDAKREHAEKCLRQCWDAAVSELLADFPETI